MFGEVHKEKFLKAYEKTYKLGEACKASAVSRTTVWKWLKDKEFKDRYDLVKDLMIDRAEALLEVDMQREDGSGRSSVMFFLKCQAKHRGYNERYDKEEVTLGAVGTLDEIDKAQEALLRDVATTEISYEAALPIFNMLAEKRRTIENKDLAKLLLEIRHNMSSK